MVRVKLKSAAQSTGVLAGSALLAFLASGCAAKRYQDVNLIYGKQLFVSKCGSCHTLARANTKGTVGPDLDAAFADSLTSGIRRSTVKSVVHGQILEPNPYGAMPKGLLDGKGSGAPADVAAYVAYAVDNPGQDTGLLAAAVKAAGAGKPAVETAGTLSIDADPTGQLAYTTKLASATAGPVTVVMKNMSGTQHNIAVQTGATGATPGGTVIGASPIISSGSTTLKLTLKPGQYTFFCQVTGHRQAGMWGTITVK
jgi:plastocyanin